MLQDIQRVCLDFPNRSSDSLNLLQGFSQREYSGRSEWSMTVQRIIDSWYFGFGSPAVAGFLESYAQDRNGSTVDTSMHANIREQLNDLLRISSTCPLQDVRAACENIMEDLKKKKHFPVLPPLYRSPSYNFSCEEMPHLKCILEKPSDDDLLYTTYVLYCEHWYRWGRLENFIQVLGYHPEFLESFLKTHEHLFHGDLPMPYPDRHYLAILAATEMRCPQLVCLFARYFLTSGGNSAWLKDLSNGPVRWRQLLALNRNLAHAPWKVSADDIYSLTRGDNKSDAGRETISLSELMHAVAIMTHIHSLVCFIFAAGVRPELDHFGSSGLPSSKADGSADVVGGFVTPAVSSRDSFHNGQTRRTGINGGPSQTKSSGAPGTGLSETSQQQDVNELLTLLQSGASDASENADEVKGDMAVELFMALAKENSRLSLPGLESKTMELSNHPVLKPFLKDPLSDYKDFCDQPFLVSEFSWSEDGCMLVDRLASDLGSMLDDEFCNAYELTYNTLNTLTNVDTAPYRHAVWNFVQSLFGICHEDVRFDKLNSFFREPQRAFLKACCTRPADLCQLMPHVVRELMPALSPSEIVHVLVMVMEARQQASLMYALRAISQSQTRRV
ncbi:hypothetical protein AAHC03_013469 [Spirometra sp. Aus1]